MTRALGVFLIALVASSVYAENPRLKAEYDLAVQDRSQFPASDHWRYWYITTVTGHPKNEQAWQATALKLIVASTTRQTVLEKCLPVQVGPTLYRIDLADLKWDLTTWLELVATYPYANITNSLVQRADWFVVQLSDANEQQTPIYYKLLFGKLPKDRNEALSILAVDSDFNKQFGWIEAKSKVSKVGHRWIANFAVGRGYVWGTRDVLELSRDHDMLELPDGSFKHDGEEWIFGLFKKHNTTGATGALQAYMLADGQGKIISRADIRLVEDTTHFRGLAEIRVPGGCIQCHPGLNFGTRDELKQLFQSGVYATSDYTNKEQIESFNFTDPSKYIQRANEDYATIIKLICGKTPLRAQQEFSAAVKAYDRDLTTARACWELGTGSAGLQQALGVASSAGAKLPARIAGLAHNLACPRISFEPAYRDLNYSIIPNANLEP